MELDTLLNNKATKPQSNQTTMAKVDKISQNEEEKRNNLTYFLGCPVLCSHF